MEPVAVSALAAFAHKGWAYPALEIAHIVGIALLVGNLAMLESRVWGLARDLAPRALARLALPLALGGFALVGVSGLAMFATQPAELLANGAFRLKLVLVCLAGLNAVFFHLRDGLIKLDLLARVQTVLSLAFWLGAIVCGRWIAYL